MSSTFARIAGSSIVRKQIVAASEPSRKHHPLGRAAEPVRSIPTIRTDLADALATSSSYVICGP